jgi:23S rRNA-/tRNA-specific pseudouridylate synthase
MKHIHHPLLCDPLYGPGNMPCATIEAHLAKILTTNKVSGIFQRSKETLFGSNLFITGQFLHALSLSFIHPSLKKVMKFESPFPTYWNEALAVLRAGI